jgi:pectin methylesterase-like acyl-CoA thioesterase
MRAVVVALGALALASSPAAATPVAGGTYQISGPNSGKCLEVRSSTADNGALSRQGRFTPVGSTQQPTVATDGTGLYRTVQAAVDAAPTNSTSRIVITIKAGTYREILTVPSNKPNVTLEGLGSAPQVLIVNNRSAYTHGTSGSATAFVNGRDFFAVNLTISNDFDESSTPEGHQAVALNLNADRAVFRNVRLLGDQDTFLVNDSTRAYMVDSYVEGTVDFIFGGGTMVFHRTAVYQKRSTGGPITAASTTAEKKYGFLFHQSTITGSGTNNTTLGRPWRPNAQVLYRESSLSATVRTSQPWTDMSTNTWQNARFLEYRNTGSGAGTNSNRPQLSDSLAADHTPQRYLAGTDGWNPVG